MPPKKKSKIKKAVKPAALKGKKARTSTSDSNSDREPYLAPRNNEDQNMDVEIAEDALDDSTQTDSRPK